MNGENEMMELFLMWMIELDDGVGSNGNNGVCAHIYDGVGLDEANE